MAILHPVAAQGATVGRIERRRCAALVLALCLALLVNDVVVMRAVYREVSHGLGADVRDVHGRPIPPRPVTAP